MTALLVPSLSLLSLPFSMRSRSRGKRDNPHPLYSPRERQLYLLSGMPQDPREKGREGRLVALGWRGNRPSSSPF